MRGAGGARASRRRRSCRSVQPSYAPAYRPTRRQLLPRELVRGWPHLRVRCARRYNQPPPTPWAWRPPSLSMRRAAQTRGVEMRARPPLGSRVPGPPCGTPRRTQRVMSEWGRCRRRQHPSERRWFLASAVGFFLPRGAQKKKVSAIVFATRARPAAMASYTKFTSSYPVYTNF